MSISTLRNRIHTAQVADFAALVTEIQNASLDLTTPYGWHLFNDHWGRELNKRYLILTGAFYYENPDSGYRPLLTSIVVASDGWQWEDDSAIAWEDDSQIEHEP